MLANVERAKTDKKPEGKRIERQYGADGLGVNSAGTEWVHDISIEEGVELVITAVKYQKEKK